VKNLIPLFVALLFIGAGCVFQPEVQPTAEITTQPAVVSQNVSGVVESYDEAAGTAFLRSATGATEEVLWPIDGPNVASLFGAVVTVTGERDPSTLALVAERVEASQAAANLAVVSPVAGATVTSPLVVSGFGRTFEQTFAWRIRGADGNVVDQGVAMTDAREAGWFGPFTFEAFLPAMDAAAFTLEVLEYSAKDGSEQSLVSVPLNLLSTRTSSFKIFFEKQSGSFDCAAVAPVERTVAETAAIGRASVAELLKGPTEAERAEGYATSIPPYAGLNSLVIGGGMARADFTSGLEPGGGACRAAAVRAQIENTLLQFDAVESVTISVNGEVETAPRP
jgi:hypothetical protein